MAGFADRFVTPAPMLLGPILMATPLALWVAWTDTILFIVLAAGVAAAVLYCILVRYERPDAPALRGGADRPA